MSTEPEILITCPKCKVVGQVPSSWRGSKVQCEDCDAMIDIPLDTRNINSGTKIPNMVADISAREKAANNISSWGVAFVVICILSGLIQVIVGFSVNGNREGEGTPLMVTGGCIFIFGFLFNAVMNWGAELLRCIGRIEDKLDK